MTFCVIWPKYFLVIWGFVNHLGRNVQKLVEWERQISQRIFHTLAASDTKYRAPNLSRHKKAWAVITFCNSFAKGGMVCEVNFLSQVLLADAGRTSLVSFLLLCWMASQDIQFQWQIAWSPFVWGSGHRSKDVFSHNIFFHFRFADFHSTRIWLSNANWNCSNANYWIFAKTQRLLRNFEGFYFTQTRGRSFDEGCEILNSSKGFLPMDDLKLKSVDEQT